MPRLPIAQGLLVLSLSAQPVLGARFLYATASSDRRVDVFPLDGSGGILERQFTFGTAAGEPRRLVVNGCFLYVAESDRVEAFRMHKDGRLETFGTTEPVPDSTPRDLAIGGSAGSAFLYVPQRVPGRIVAYPLAADGSPARPPDSPDGKRSPWKYQSCAQGRQEPGYQTIAVENGLVYVGSLSGIEAYAVTTAGIAGKVCPEQNPARLALGPGTADVLVTELNPSNVQCYPDFRRDEQFPVIPTTTSTTITEGTGTTTTTSGGTGTTTTTLLPKGQVSFLHTDPEDTGTSSHEATRLRDVRKETGNPKERLSDRVFYTCPDSFAPDNCRDASRTTDPTNRETCPVTLRKFDGGVQDLEIDGQRLFVDQTHLRVLSSVLLGSDGSFDAFLCRPDNKTKRTDSPVCTPTNVVRNNVGAVKGSLVVQTNPASKLNVDPDAGLSSLSFDPATNLIYAPRFSDGTIKSYRVQDVGGLPKVKKAGSNRGDLRSSPFRVTIDGGVLYVAAGQFDRVQAFRMLADGPAATPFSWRDVPEGSFPNDVAVAVPDDCDP